MATRVIQGFFIGGQAHPAPGVVRPVLVQRATAPARQQRIGPPTPSFAGRLGAIQRFGGNDSFEIDPGRIGLARGGGQPLPRPLLAKMEAAFGADFSSVRVHVGPQAARIGAVAFTTGNDLYFAPGRYQPDSVQGQQLIGHELAHVIQQRQGRVRAPGNGVSVVQDHALEAEADRLGMRAAMHRVAVQPKMASASPLPVQRQTVQRHGDASGGGIRISAPMPAGNGSFRLSASAGSTSIGSVMIHPQRGGVSHITDLEVSPGHRDQGVGKMLLASAARAGMARGNARVSLHADDKGSGRLNRWYKSMGFAEAGARLRGQPRLEASAMQIAGAVAQRQAAGPPMAIYQGRASHAPARPFGTAVQRAAMPAAAAAAVAIPTTTKAGGVITNRGVSTVKNKDSLHAMVGKTRFDYGSAHAEVSIIALLEEDYATWKAANRKKGAVRAKGAFGFEMTGWPCEACDAKLAKAATDYNLQITVDVTDDKSGYARDHKLPFKTIGTVTYN